MRILLLTQVVPYPWVASTPLVEEYQKLYVKAKKAEPSYNSMEGFLAARVLVEGLRRSGPQLTAERFVEAMEGLRSLDLGGYGIGYSASDRQGSQFVELTVLGPGGKILR